MTAGNFAQALAHVLVHEGGKDDDPRDPGGRTNAGITHIDYDLYRKSKGLPLRDVWDMDNQERDDIYRTRYWDAVNGDTLPSGVDYVTFDGAVNSGIAQSVKWLQRAVGGTIVDGNLGPVTLAAVVNNPDLAKVVKAALQARRDFLQQLRTFAVFGKGWMKRVDDVEAVALAWIAGQQLPSIIPVPQAHAKATRASAVSPPVTAPGDVITAVAGAGLATALIANTHAVAIAPATSAATAPVALSPPAPSPPAVAPPTLPTPSASATSPPPAATLAKPAPASAAAPSHVPAIAEHPAKPINAATIVASAQPHPAFLTIPESKLPLIATGMGVLFVSGLILSWSARQARTRFADALGDAPTPQTALKLAATAAAAYVAKSTSISTWTSFAKTALARVLSTIWIMGTIAVNVIALAKLLQVLSIEHEAWHGPFIALGNFYDGYAGQAFAATSVFVAQHSGFTLPLWLMPAFVLYVSMASAFVVGGTGIVGRDTSAETFLGAIVHAGWILAIPAFVLDAIRYQVVTRFARQNTVVFFAYILAFCLIYVGARYVNEHYFASPSAQTTAIMTQIGGDAAKLGATAKKP